MSPSPSKKVCFNSGCKTVSDRPRKGWRRRTGDFADLCDRCASAYEEGKFCETFHSTSSGWRACESCGKKIHCGCIVSFHTFVLLDEGGIECITCARKSFILTPNPAWPPPIFHPLQSEGSKDSKSWTPIAGSGPLPWRQAPSMFNGSVIQTELQLKKPYGDITGSKDRLQLTEKSPLSCLENKDKVDSFGIFLSESRKSSVSGKVEKEITGFGFAGKPNPFGSVTQQTNSSKNDFSSPSVHLTVSSTAGNEARDSSKVFETQTQPNKLSPPMGRQSCSHNCTDSSSGEVQMCGGKLQGGVGVKPSLARRYNPRITDQELRQISANTNCVITPLFEKMLSASDTSKVGRLVLPKKCAEVYFPPILQPEGLPLKVQDPRGKEWVFQFRYWPNNNSRVYVLEGFTACMQSMQLQAGDIVTFSRTEPEGKLILGCRKHSSAPSVDQGHGTSKNNFSDKIAKPGESSTKCSAKFHLAPPGVPINNQAPSMGSRNNLSESNESNCTTKEVLETKPPVPTKKQNDALNSKSKRVRIDSEQSTELNLTAMEAQQLMRPSPSEAPTVVVIDGCEFEEYEHEAPVIGRPTIPCTGSLGEKFQWAQCEDCYKWRKIPGDALLPARWTCSQNIWDLYRSVCSAVQDEFNPESLAGFSPTNHKAKRKKASPKHDIKSSDTSTTTMAEALANLAIEEEEVGPTEGHELPGKDVGPAEADGSSLSSESCRDQPAPHKGGGIDLNVKPDSPVSWHHESPAGDSTAAGPDHCQVIDLNGGGPPSSCGDRDPGTFDLDMEVGEMVKFPLVHMDK